MIPTYVNMFMAKTMLRLNILTVACLLKTARKNMTRQYTLAWNEHDEGGWCCPTLAVYENGMPVRGENGEPIMDRTYLDALKKALRDIRKKKE